MPNCEKEGISTVESMSILLYRRQIVNIERPVFGKMPATAYLLPEAEASLRMP